MLPPAPPPFSITIGCPRELRMRSAMMRAAASVDPPGGNGTTSVMARDGKPCACAPAMPANTDSTSATKNFLMIPPVKRPPAWSVNFSRTLQRLFQFFQRKARAAGDFQDRRLAAAAEFGRVRQFWRDIERNHHGAVTIGVNEIAGAHRHPGDPDFAAKTLGVNPGVRRADRTGEGLE